MEKRLPIVVVGRLAQAERAGADGDERTYTDNISARGARVYSVRLWQLGDAVLVTPQNEAPTCGNVVYCQRLADDRYAVGVRFLDPTIAWFTVRRFDGLTHQPGARSNPS
jgi:PilZ domain